MLHRRAKKNFNDDSILVSGDPNSVNGVVLDASLDASSSGGVSQIACSALNADRLDSFAAPNMNPFFDVLMELDTALVSIAFHTCVLVFVCTTIGVTALWASKCMVAAVS